MRKNGSARTMMLLLLAVVVLGIYILPSAVAKFAGSHTWEFNETGVTALKCGRCHAYITSEIGPYDGATKNVFRAHANALNNSNYINDSGAPINMSTFSGNVDNTTVCLMCHVVESGATITGTHTKVTIRVCTDIDCHGNYAGGNDTPGNINCNIWSNAVCNVTGRINSTADGHRNFYYPLTAWASPYGNENGGQYDYGFVACLACHTHVGLSLNFTRPNELEAEFNLTSLTGSSTSAPWNITNLYVNMSSRNYSYGGKDPGSVWY